MAPTSFKLNCGIDMPAVGLGTWQGDAKLVEEAVLLSLQSGYKMIDAAFAYANEDAVGRGIKKAIDTGVCKREDIFVTTKLWNTHKSTPDQVPTRTPEVCLDKSLKALGLDYVDQYLVHWPVAMNPRNESEYVALCPDGTRDMVWDYDHIDTWKDMEALLKSGKTKSIGVSNYSVPYLTKLLAKAEIVPAVNQIENHPLCPQQEIVDLCKAKGIHIVAYSPLGSTGSPLMKKEGVIKVAEKHNCSPGTVLLSYHAARGSSVLAKSTTPSRIKSNLEIIDLDASDMAALAESTKDGIERVVFPAFNIDLGFPDKPVGKKMPNGVDP